MAALEYWLWLSSAPVSFRAKALLLERFGDPESAFFAPPGSFRGIHGISPLEAAALELKDRSGVSRIREECQAQGLQIISLQDAAYPNRLRHIYAPPVVLYVRGRMPALDENAPVAVIGTRNASAYGLQMGRDLAYQIVKCGGIVVSGLTRGIDAEAARGALLADGCCVAVLGTPHEQERGFLAKDVAARGAVLSEYPPGMAAQRSFFRERNRIAAGISVGVLVVEAPAKRGTRLFAEEAAEQGKELFAVPGCVNDENSAGTLAMLKEGAKLVTCGWDVMSEFQGLYPDKIHPPESTAAPVETPSEETAETVAGQKAVDKAGGEDYIDLEKQLAGLSEEQLKIIAAIDRNSSHIDDIVEATGLPVGKVLGNLTLLEVKGYIRRDAGKRITLKIAKK